MSKIQSFVRVAALVVPLAVSSTASAQIVTRRQRATEEFGPATTFVGGSITYAQPQGEFKDYVQGAVGVNGHLVQAFGPGGIVALRAEVGYLLYGSATRRQPLGGGALGLVNVDVTTSNNIVNGGVGLQLMLPSGPFRPYLSGNVGLAYFFTQSSIQGTGDGESFASSENYGDGGMTTNWGGGFYIPIRAGRNPVALDFGVQTHSNADVQYLTKESITVTDSDSPPTISPVRSAANFLTFRLGVSVGVR